MEDKNILAWNDVQDAAELAFAVWVGQPELRWARQAWEIMVQAGLATYTSETERCEAAMRFLALGGIYHDFCDVAWEEPSDPWYTEWADALRLGAFRVGQLVGRPPDLDQEEDEDEAVSSGLRLLADKAREEVFAALRDGFGGVSMLFVSLWRSNKLEDEAPSQVRGKKTGQLTLSFFDEVEDDDEDDEDDDEEEDEDRDETDEEILNNVTPEKVAAFEWIEGGCRPYH